MNAGDSTSLGKNVSHLRRQVCSRRCHSLRQVSHPALGFVCSLLVWPIDNESNTLWGNRHNGILHNEEILVAKNSKYAFSDTYVSFGSSNLNICTVSVLLEQQSHIESILNERLLIVTHLLTPRRNSNNFVPSWTCRNVNNWSAMINSYYVNTQLHILLYSTIYLTSKTLITVPFSEAVATLVPVELKAIAANGLSCAGIIVLACYITKKYVIIKYGFSQYDDIFICPLELNWDTYKMDRIEYLDFSNSVRSWIS